MGFQLVYISSYSLFFVYLYTIAHTVCPSSHLPRKHEFIGHAGQVQLSRMLGCSQVLIAQAENEIGLKLNVSGKYH